LPTSLLDRGQDFYFMFFYLLEVFKFLTKYDSLGKQNTQSFRHFPWLSNKIYLQDMIEQIFAETFIFVNMFTNTYEQDFIFSLKFYLGVNKGNVYIIFAKIPATREILDDFRELFCGIWQYWMICCTTELREFSSKLAKFRFFSKMVKVHFGFHPYSRLCWVKYCVLGSSEFRWTA
jgi:hypothetical protein